MKVLMWPARRNGASNSYNRRLSDALEEASVSVVEFVPRRALFGSYDILHVHWPEGVFKDPRKSIASAKGAAVLLVLGIARYGRKRRVIWTVHNLQPHDVMDRMGLRIFYWILTRIVNGCVFLSLSGRELALQRFPVLESRPWTVAPIGRYAGEFRPRVARDDVRRGLGLAPDVRLFSFVGAVRPYKGADKLLRCFVRGAGPRDRLLIAGEIADNAYADQLLALASGDARVVLLPEWLTPERMAELIVASDLIVYPFTSGLNSSSVLVPPELHRPVLVPRIGSMEEVSDEIGNDWVELYAPPLKFEYLENCLLRTRRDGPRLSGLTWSSIAERTRDFYLRMLAT